MLLNISFQYIPEISPDDVYTVFASVHLGKTSARGDDPDNVLDLYVEDGRGDYTPVPDDVFLDLCELAIINAKEEAAV